MIRAVLDTNVFVSAVINPKGVPARILNAWRDDQFQLLMSEPILNEIAAVLRYPKTRRRHQWSEQQIDTFLEDLAHLAIILSPKQPVTVVVEDPPDNRYLECAAEGQAECLVSGDQHLLKVKTWQGISILTPAGFLALLQSQA